MSRNGSSDGVDLADGVVLELCLARALTTKDMARVLGAPDALERQLRAACARGLRDYLHFDLVPDPARPTIEGEGIVYTGRRYRASAQLAGRPYGDSLGVGVGFADLLVAPPEVLTGSTFLEFADVAPPRLQVYPRESHVAEKLHAYTLPHPRENTRVKDLPDLARTGSFDGE